MDRSGFRTTSLSLDEDEARAALRAFDRKVIPTIRRYGGFRWPKGNPHGGESPFQGGPREGKIPRTIEFRREAIVTLGAIGDLVLDYGWDINHIWVEPRTSAFDFVLFAGPKETGPAIVAGESKRSRHGMERLVDQLLDCCQQGPEHDPCRHKDSHKKYLGLLLLKPSFLWTVAPGARRAFVVTFEGASPALVEIADVPARPSAPRASEVGGVPNGGH
jgi:hypothetical protein